MQCTGSQGFDITARKQINKLLQYTISFPQESTHIYDENDWTKSNIPRE